MKQALRCGLGVLEFWELTPYETTAAIEAGVQRLQAERELAISLAWHTAALQRAKRLPALAGLLARIKPREAMPIEKRRDEFEELKARMGKISNLNFQKARGNQKGSATAPRQVNDGG